MTFLGIQIALLAVQVTVVATLAWLLAMLTSRREARSTVVVLAGAMAIFLTTGVASFCPVPDFCRWSPFPAIELKPKNSSAVTGVEAVAAPSTSPKDSKNGGFSLAQALAWMEELRRPTARKPVQQSPWTILAGLYVAGVLIGGIRLLSSAAAIRSLRRRSCPIYDAELLGLAVALRVAQGCARKVDVCECSEAGLTATAGWWRPVIFLPPEWRGWTEDERRAVLAHELAHVRNRDYLIGLLTRLGEVVFFYHPLVRWLAASLRWQQELAADAVAASGCRNVYLRSLARLALRSPARTPAGAMAWSAMSGGALLRRIDMLRGTEKRRPLGWTMHGVMFGLLAGAGLLVSTLGTPASPPAQEHSHQLEPFDLGYLGPDAKGFIGIRPSIVFKQPHMEPASSKINEGLQLLSMIGIDVPVPLRPENIDQVVTDLRFTSAGTGKPGSRSLQIAMSSMLIRMNRDFDWVGFFKGLSKGLKRLPKNDIYKDLFTEVKESRKDGVTIYTVGKFGPDPICFSLPDNRTIVFSICSDLRHLIRSAPTARKRSWGSGWSQVSRAPVAMVLDNQDHHYAKVFAADLKKNDVDVLNDIRFAALGIELGDGKPVRLVLDGQSTAAASRLEGAIDRYANLLRKSTQETVESKAPEEKMARKLATELLDSRKVRRDGTLIECVGYTAVRVHHLMEMYSEKKPD